VTITIRPAAMADVPALLTIEYCSFMPGDAFNRRQIRDLVTNEHALCRVIAINDQVVGWTVGFIRQHRHHRSARIYTLSIDPTFRGRGLARQLMLHMIDELTSRQARHLYLEVRVNNHKALSLYDRLGFQAVRLLRDYYGSTEHGLSMRLNLPFEPTLFVPATTQSTEAQVQRLAP
jgi:ribosomal-protein-alanine N-acetyltransferase